MIFPAIWSRLAAIVVSYLALPESAASSRNASLSQIEPFVQDLVDRYHIPGLAVAVVREDTEGGDKFENYQAHFGTATTEGKVVDGDVSGSFPEIAHSSHCSLLRPTRSCSRTLPLDS